MQLILAMFDKLEDFRNNPPHGWVGSHSSRAALLVFFGTWNRGFCICSILEQGFSRNVLPKFAWCRGQPCVVSFARLEFNSRVDNSLRLCSARANSIFPPQTQKNDKLENIATPYVYLL